VAGLAPGMNDVLERTLVVFEEINIQEAWITKSAVLKSAFFYRL
jgi:hypothetical protein